MTQTSWSLGVLGGTAAWLLLFGYPGLAEVSGESYQLPLMLSMHPIVAGSVYMDGLRLKEAGETWPRRPVVFALPALAFPAVVGPLYLFLRILNVET